MSCRVSIYEDMSRNIVVYTIICYVVLYSGVKCYSIKCCGVVLWCIMLLPVVLYHVLVIVVVFLYYWCIICFGDLFLWRYSILWYVIGRSVLLCCITFCYVLCVHVVSYCVFLFVLYLPIIHVLFGIYYPVFVWYGMLSCAMLCQILVFLLYCILYYSPITYSIALCLCPIVIYRRAWYSVI